MACLLVLKKAAFARDRALVLMVNMSMPPPQNYVVADARGGRIVKAREHFTRDEALEFFDERELMEYAYEPSGWKATLARLTDTVETPGVWLNSTSEFVSRFFNPGTWEWVEALVLARKRIEGGRAIAAQNATQ